MRCVLAIAIALDRAGIGVFLLRDHERSGIVLTVLRRRISISCEILSASRTLLVCFRTGSKTGRINLFNYIAECMSFSRNGFGIRRTAIISGTCVGLYAWIQTVGIGINYSIIPSMSSCISILITSVNTQIRMCCILAVTVALDRAGKVMSGGIYRLSISRTTSIYTSISLYAFTCTSRIGSNLAIIPSMLCRRAILITSVNAEIRMCCILAVTVALDRAGKVMSGGIYRLSISRTTSIYTSISLYAFTCTSRIGGYVAAVPEVAFCTTILVTSVNAEIRMCCILAVTVALDRAGIGVFLLRNHEESLCFSFGRVFVGTGSKIKLASFTLLISLVTGSQASCRFSFYRIDKIMSLGIFINTKRFFCILRLCPFFSKDSFINDLSAFKTGIGRFSSNRCDCGPAISANGTYTVSHSADYAISGIESRPICGCYGILMTQRINRRLFNSPFITSFAFFTCAITGFSASRIFSGIINQVSVIICIYTNRKSTCFILAISRVLSCIFGKILCTSLTLLVCIITRCNTGSSKCRYSLAKIMARFTCISTS